MKWGSQLSMEALLEDAVTVAASSITDQLDGESPDVLFVFSSPHHAASQDEMTEILLRQFGECNILGCSSGGVIGAGIESERGPGFAVSAAVLPGVSISLFHIENDSLPNEDSPQEDWNNALNISPGTQPEFVLLTDPYSFDANRLIAGLDYAFPKSTKIGGLASAGYGDRVNSLYLHDRVYHSGAIGVCMTGSVTIDAIVAQGCRPIGIPMKVSSSTGNWLIGLDEKKPLELLAELLGTLDEKDSKLAKDSLFIGMAMDRLNDEPSMGEFLIRNIVGLDQARGYMAIGEIPSEGQLVQFHLRDAIASSEELEILLNNYAEESPIYEECGALLFSCLGRASALYGKPGHDSDMFRSKVNQMPLAGFFCNGEIGPVEGNTFLHTYTSSFGIFRSRSTS